MRKIMIVSLAAMLALAACGKKPEEPAATNNLVEPPVENVIVDEPDAPVPEPSNNAVATPPAPPPSVSERQQIQDDAEASGMTSRLREEGESSQSTDEASNSGE